MRSRAPWAQWPPRDADHLLVRSAEMASLEERLFDSGLPVEALMEKAALAVSRRLLASPPERAMVLVGPGHNGGDGLVVARELHLAGVPTSIWFPFERCKPLTDAHLRHARWLGIPVLTENPDPRTGDLWVDALFGIGQNRAPGARLEAVLRGRQTQRPHRLVAIDGPTGICADTGRLLGEEAATASLTYAIGLIKQGFVQDAGLRWVGRLERIDLGLPASLLAELSPEQPLGLGLTDAMAAADQRGCPWPAIDPAAAKYGRGRLLVVAGSRRYRGAAQLALAGASAAGCGSLRAALPAEVAEALWTVQPHVVLEPPLDATADDALALGSLAPSSLERLDAVLIGPGLGGTASPEGLDTWGRLREFPGLLVIDADGLNRLATGVAEAEATTAAAWLRQRGGPTWITPHPGEFARLFPDHAPRPPLEAAARAAEDSDAAVLLKGARSVVAGPDGRRWQLLRASAQAARAGLGDVLAGYAAARGAMVLAAGGESPSAHHLAAAALDHAQAAFAAVRREGPGGATPQAVAAALRGAPMCGFAITS